MWEALVLRRSDEYKRRPTCHRQGGELQEARSGAAMRKVGQKPAVGCRLLSIEIKSGPLQCLNRTS